MSSDIVIRLRGHHLLCMLAYVGYGYTPAFTKAFDRAVTAIGGGATIEIVEGKDDLCDTLDPQTQPDYHCDEARNLDRDARALQSINDVLSMDLVTGSRFQVTAEMETLMRAAFKTGTIRKACDGCEWHATCTEIADRRFEGVKLHVEDQEA